MARKLKHIAKDFDDKSTFVKRKLSGSAIRAAGEVHRRGFVESFDKGRFNDDGSRAWAQPRRKEGGAFTPPTKSHRTRATLIGSRGGGMSGLKGSFDVNFTGRNTVIIENTKEYAAIHNEGGTLKVSVSDKMRKFAWAMWYKTKHDSWKGLALTKKKNITMTIPQRKFMGHSRALDKEAIREINFILDKEL